MLFILFSISFEFGSSDRNWTLSSSSSWQQSACKKPWSFFRFSEQIRYGVELYIVVRSIQARLMRPSCIVVHDRTHARTGFIYYSQIIRNNIYIYEKLRVLLLLRAECNRTQVEPRRVAFFYTCKRMQMKEQFYNKTTTQKIQIPIR